MTIPENILGILIWAALIYFVFRLLSDSLYALLRIVIAIFVTAEIVYFLREFIDMPFLDKISWKFVEDINRAIFEFIQSIPYRFG